MSRTYRRRGSDSSDDSISFPPTTPLLSTHSLMSSVDPSLPPTTHLLAPKDRTLLIRSTRKLGQLLGTTPHLLELTTSPPIAHGKLARRATVPPQPAQPPTLRVQPDRPRARRPSSASSLSSSRPHSPISAPADPVAARRQKMDKLKRTLGENVPAELVFGVNSSSAGSGSAVGLGARNLLRNAKAKTRTEAEGAKGAAISLWKRASQGVLGSNAHPHKRRRPEDLAAPAYPVGGGRTRRHPRTPPVTARSIPTRSLSEPAVIPLTPPPELPSPHRPINVRRATKMAQVFGTPPPHSLHQITNNDVLDISPDRQQELARLAYLLDHDRDSLYDLLATARSSSPDVDWPYENRPPSHSSPTPVPMSPGFHTRRRRAAKLSRFFGVEYPRLYECMLTFDAKEDAENEADGDEEDIDAQLVPLQMPPTPPPKGSSAAFPARPKTAGSVSGTVLPVPLSARRPKTAPQQHYNTLPREQSKTTPREQHHRSSSLNVLALETEPAPPSPRATRAADAHGPPRARTPAFDVRPLTPAFDVRPHTPAFDGRPRTPGTAFPEDYAPPSPPPFVGREEWAGWAREEWGDEWWDGGGGSGHGHENEHANGHANGSANGHANGSAGGSASEHAGEDVTTTATVHVVQGPAGALGRVVGRRGAGAGQNMQGVMNRLRELPGARR